MGLTAISSLEWARKKIFMNSTYIMSREQKSNVFGSGCQNEPYSKQLARMGEKKISLELDVHNVQKVEIKRFSAQQANMRLTAISSLESARRKFFMNSTNIMSRRYKSNVFGSRGQNEPNSKELAGMGEKKIFLELDVHHVQKVGIKPFLGSRDRNDSISHQLDGIGEKKIFHELNVHHVQKVGIKRFSAQEAEISLTAMSSLQWARRELFMNSTYIMSRKQKLNVFRLRRPK